MLTFWWVIVYCLIPLAVFLLICSTWFSHDGLLGRFHNTVLPKILFYPIPGAGPNLPFIKFLLISLSLVAGITALQVYLAEWRDPLPASTPLDKQLMHQGKIWRNQRNLYLTCLALALWWMVYELFNLKLRYGIIQHDNAHAAAVARAHAGGGHASASAPRPQPPAQAQAQGGNERKQD